MAVAVAVHGWWRDEQVRWLLEVWNASNKLKEEGADMRAVTIWSMFGAADWNTLLTQKNGFYETGVFDARCKPLRPTVLAAAAASLAKNGNFDHPVLDQAGWWRREGRHYRCPERSTGGRLGRSPRRRGGAGAGGARGRAFS